MTGLKRLLVILISGSLCFLLQLLVLPRVDFLIALPNLILILVMSTGFLFGKAYGLFVGFVSGLILDVIGTGTPGFQALILMLLGYADGFLSEKMESEIIPVLFLILLANELPCGRQVLPVPVSHGSVCTRNSPDASCFPADLRPAAVCQQTLGAQDQ